MSSSRKTRAPSSSVNGRTHGATSIRWWANSPIAVSISRAVTAYEPVIRRSPSTTSRPGSSVASPWSPIHTTSPPGRTISTAARRVTPAPTASTTTSAIAPRVLSRSSATTSWRVGLKTGSAPTACAICSRASFVSTAISVSAPPARATCKASSPMAPQPITTTISGKRTVTSDHTWTALASGSISAPSSGPTRSGSGKSTKAGAATRSANAPGRFIPKIWRCGQRWVAPARHDPHRPHGITDDAATRSPTFTSWTPGPSSSTSPQNS